MAGEEGLKGFFLPCSDQKRFLDSEMERLIEVAPVSLLRAFFSPTTLLPMQLSKIPLLPVITTGAWSFWCMYRWYTSNRLFGAK